MTRSPLFAGPEIFAVAFAVFNSCARSISCLDSPVFASFTVFDFDSFVEVFLFGCH